MCGRAGTSGRGDAGNPHREHRVLSCCRRVHGPPHRASHPVHADLPALPVLPACAPTARLHADAEHTALLESAINYAGVSCMLTAVHTAPYQLLMKLDFLHHPYWF